MSIYDELHGEADADALRAHYGALRAHLAAAQSDAPGTRTLLLAQLEVRAERARERRRTFAVAAMALGCVVFLGVPGAWALSRVFDRAPAEAVSALPALDVEHDGVRAAALEHRASATAAPRSSSALRRRRAVAAASATPSIREQRSALARDDDAPGPAGDEGAASAEALDEHTPSENDRDLHAVDRVAPPSYLRAIDLVRRLRDDEAEPLLRAVIADPRSGRYRREASRVLDLLLARRGAEATMRD